jgi:hypothetical protein
MKRIILLALGFMGASIAAYAQCNPNISNIYTYTFNGNGYEIIKENLNWVDAAACAATRGGRLVELNSKAEQDTFFAKTKLAGIENSSTMAPDGGGASYIWIGGNDKAQEEKWIWDGDNTGASVHFWQGGVLGSTVGGLFTNWGNEPDDFGGQQDALGFAITNWPLGVAGQWNDVNENNLLYYAIEYVGLSAVDELQAGTFTVFPNPSAGQFKLQLQHENGLASHQVEVFNMLGESVFKAETNHSLAIDLSLESKGMYLVKVQEGTSVCFKRILVQ